MTIQITTLSLDDATRIVAAGMAEAKKIGSPSNVAVVDIGGNLVTHVRMDGAQIASITHSIDKAFTSVACRSATRDLAKDALPGGQFYGIASSLSGRIIVFAGGIPITSDGEIIGAVGVSGGTGEQDQRVAEAAAAAF